MKIKGIKISTLGWGIAKEKDLVGLRNPYGHLEWVSSVSSHISDRSIIWNVTLFNHRSGSNNQKLLVYKLDKYIGSGPINSNSILELTYMSSFKTTTKHHSEIRQDPYIILSA